MKDWFIIVGLSLVFLAVWILFMAWCITIGGVLDTSGRVCVPQQTEFRGTHKHETTDK
jgi:hypothetical protein